MKTLKKQHNKWEKKGKTFTNKEEISGGRAHTNTQVSLPLQLMKAAVPAESYTLYPLSSRSVDSDDVYCQ